MKTIYEILSGLGLEVPEDRRESLDRELAESYKTMDEFNKQAGKLAQAADKLKTAEEGLKAFEGVDVPELRERVGKLQKELEDKDAAYLEKLSAMEFNARFTGAVTAAGGRSVKAILGELGEERLTALQASKNQESDIKTALEDLRKDSSYLFAEEAAYNPPAGGAPSAVNSLRDAIAEKLTGTKE